MSQIKPIGIKKRKITCRRCAIEMDRIPREPLVKSLLFWLPLKRYKCHVCQRKMYTMAP